MKYRSVFCIILIPLLLVNLGIEALARDTGFSTESLTEGEKDTILKNINILVLEEEPPKRAIECFDVNENGLIAVGCGDSEYKTVCIYTSDGIFQCGYSFKTSGTFGIELNQDVLNIYLVRSDVVIAINSTGEIESILKIQDTTANNSYWNNSVFATVRKIGNNEYTLKNDLGFFNVFASSYSQLVKTSANGEATVIYDVSSTQYSSMVITLVAVLVSFGIVAIALVCQFVKQRRGV